MFNRKVVQFFVLVVCLSFWGCSHRFDRFGFFRPKSDKKVNISRTSQDDPYLLRLVTTALKHDKSVLREDANNFSTFFLEQLVKDKNFSVELNPEAIEQFSSLGNQANPDALKDLGKKYKVEALVRGRIKDYSYKLGRREFSVALHVEIEGINTHNSVAFFNLDKKFKRSFRLRGRRQRDMSSYNLRFLNEVMNGISESFNEQFEPLVLAQKSRHGGLIPTKVLADDAGPGPHSRDQLMHLYLWPVSPSGQEKIGPQPLIVKSSTLQAATASSQKSEKIREMLSEEKEKESVPENIVDPEQLILRSAREAEQRTSQPESLDRLSIAKVINDGPEIDESSKSPIEYDSSLNLEMPNFQLVYPEKILASKQYQKLYYLRKDDSKKVSALDLESASEEVLELEIFTTYDRTAVKKFLGDYFHGSHPSPRGKIPAVFERYYLGKLQIGFVLDNKAFIASTHRNNREVVDKTIQSFYVNNGGVTVAKILDTSLRNRQLDNIVFSKSKKTEYLPSVQEGNEDSSKFNRRPIEDSGASELEVPIKAPEPRSKEEGIYYSEDQPETIPKISDSSPSDTGALEYEDGTFRNPYDFSDNGLSTNRNVNQSVADDGRVEANLPQNTKAVDNFSVPPFSEKKLEPVEISSNASFYYDIGRRYFISDQYELSKRYMNLAFENGYRSEELDEYLDKIEKRLNPGIRNFNQKESLDTVESGSSRYVYNPDKTSPAVDSGALDFEAGTKSKSLSFGNDNQRDKALQEFYSEMDKMEAELRQYTKNKRQLATSANGYYSSPGMADLAFQILAIVALVLFFLSFLSSRRIPASPIYSDPSKDTNKNS